MPEATPADHVETCPEAHHRYLDVFLYWCPRDQRFCLWSNDGRTDEPGRSFDWKLGPFDDAESVRLLLEVILGESALLSLQLP